MKTFLNGALVSNIVIDTTRAATDTIDYVATDGAGLTSTSTRTVYVDAPMRPILRQRNNAARFLCVGSTGIRLVQFAMRHDLRAVDAPGYAR